MTTKSDLEKQREYDRERRRLTNQRKAELGLKNVGFFIGEDDLAYIARIKQQLSEEKGHKVTNNDAISFIISLARQVTDSQDK